MTEKQEEHNITLQQPSTSFNEGTELSAAQRVENFMASFVQTIQQDQISDNKMYYNTDHHSEEEMEELPEPSKPPIK